MRPWNIVFGWDSRPPRPPSQARKDNQYIPPPPGGCSSTLAAFTCCAFLERGPSYSMLRISNDNCCESWGAPMRHVIHRNTIRFAECRLDQYEAFLSCL